MYQGRNMIAVKSLVRTAGVSVIAFILLNIADAWLTQQLLAHEGVEAFWWSSSFNSSVLIKGLLAFLVAVVLMRVGKARLLRWLNAAMVIVVISNVLCFLSYQTSWFYWQSQISTFSPP